jgi:Ca2+-dependent lipid-binding protein
MKNSNIQVRAAILLVALAGISSYSFSKDKPKEKENSLVLHGAVMDSQCAFNVHSDAHSHEWMTKRGVQGATDEESCTQHCVKDMGGSYVLVAKKDVYKLDDQVRAEQYAGKKVKVSGTLDETSHTVHIYEMEEEK